MKIKVEAKFMGWTINKAWDNVHITDMEFP